MAIESSCIKQSHLYRWLNIRFGNHVNTACGAINTYASQLGSEKSSRYDDPHLAEGGSAPVFSQTDSKVCGPGESQRAVFREVERSGLIEQEAGDHRQLSLNRNDAQENVVQPTQYLEEHYVVLFPGGGELAPLPACVVAGPSISTVAHPQS